MITFENIFLAFIGLSIGVIESAAVFAFIIALNILTRLAHRTNTASHIMFYEDSIILGGILGNIIIIFEPHLPFGYIGLVVYGVFAGIFVGCLALALAEALKVFPIFVSRMKFQVGIPVLVIAIAIGKCLGSLYQLFIHR